MNVGELVELLRGMPQHLPVIVHGTDGDDLEEQLTEPPVGVVREQWNGSVACVLLQGDGEPFPLYVDRPPMHGPPRYWETRSEAIIRTYRAFEAFLGGQRDENGSGV